MAVLLKRPHHHKGRLETVNDLDCHVCNLWRSVQYDPETVIYSADYPVSEPDLHAWHKYLIEWMTDERRERFMVDPSYHEAQVAGRWLWGICQWIGGQWCASGARRFPEIATGGRCIVSVPQRKRPIIGNGPTSGGTGHGVCVVPHRTKPSISTNVKDSQAPGRGVISIPGRRRPGVAGDQGGGGMRGVLNDQADWKGLIMALTERLRYVRVCSGNWTRVTTKAVLGADVGPVGILLDPPYGAAADRCKATYAEESLTVAEDCRAWAKDWEDHPNIRIALCGYEGEHNELQSRGWSVEAWKASGGYARKGGKGLDNRHRERIWFSPHCLEPARQLGLGLDI